MCRPWCGVVVSFVAHFLESGEEKGGRKGRKKGKKMKKTKKEEQGCDRCSHLFLPSWSRTMPAYAAKDSVGIEGREETHGLAKAATSAAAAAASAGVRYRYRPRCEGSQRSGTDNDCGETEDGEPRSACPSKD